MQWISVKDRLPTTYEESGCNLLLFCLSKDKTNYSILEGRYINNYHPNACFHEWAFKLFGNNAYIIYTKEQIANPENQEHYYHGDITHWCIANIPELPTPPESE